MTKSTLTNIPYIHARTMNRDQTIVCTRWLCVYLNSFCNCYNLFLLHLVLAFDFDVEFIARSLALCLHPPLSYSFYVFCYSNKLNTCIYSLLSTSFFFISLYFFAFISLLYFNKFSFFIEKKRERERKSPPQSNHIQRAHV